MLQEIFNVKINIPEVLESLGSSKENTVYQVLGYDNDEQGVFLEYAMANLSNWLQETPENTYFIEPGFGSGILGLVGLKNFEDIIRNKQIRYLGVDPNPRAKILAEKNAETNGILDICKFETGLYQFESYPKSAGGIIFQNVPYHTCQSQYQNFVQVSCGGSHNGQKWLVDHLIKSSYHLAENGTLLGIVSCRGSYDLPEFLTSNSDFNVRKYFPEDEITWIPIHQPIETDYFLNFINENNEQNFAKEVSNIYPMFHVGLYEIKRNTKGKNKPIQIKNFDFSVEHKYGKNGWGMRLDAHRAIQQNAVKYFKSLFE